MKATAERCDFCSAQGFIPWTYPANYGTPWGACDACHDLIEAGDRSGLLDRSVNHAPEMRSLSRADRRELRGILRAKIGDLHDNIFWKFCTSPPYRESIAYDGETQRSKQ